MLGVVQGAYGMAQRMHGAKALDEGRRPHDGGGHHVAPCHDVIALRNRARQPIVAHLDTHRSDGIGHRMELPHKQCFEIVRQRVHAGPGGEIARQ